MKLNKTVQLSEFFEKIHFWALVDCLETQCWKKSLCYFIRHKLFHHWIDLFCFEDSPKFIIIWPFTMSPRDSQIKLSNIQVFNKY